jgi:hypothetical protein
MTRKTREAKRRKKQVDKIKTQNHKLVERINLSKGWEKPEGYSGPLSGSPEKSEGNLIKQTPEAAESNRDCARAAKYDKSYKQLHVDEHASVARP